MLVELHRQRYLSRWGKKTERNTQQSWRSHYSRINKHCYYGYEDNTCNMTPCFCLPLVRLMTSRQILQVYSPSSGWRSVCSEDWTEKHTQTACNQLGYTKWVSHHLGETYLCVKHCRMCMWPNLLSPHFCVTSKPKSTNVQVNTLMSSMKSGPFAAVRPATKTTPVHQATTERWDNIFKVVDK